MLTINLLDENLKKVLKKQSLAKKLNILSSLFAGLVVIIAVSIFFFNKYLDIKLQKAETELEETKALILSYDTIFASMNVISQRLVSIEKILDARIVAEEKIDLFITLVDSKLFRPTTVGFGDPSEPFYFEFSGSSTNLASYTSADSYIKELTLSEPLKSVLVSNLNRLGTGQYAYTYKIYFDEDQL